MFLCQIVHSGFATIYEAILEKQLEHPELMSLVFLLGTLFSLRKIKRRGVKESLFRDSEGAVSPGKQLHKESAAAILNRRKD